MTDFPDVLGLELTQAEKLLKQLNCSFKTLETVSRRKQPIEGEYRVIGQRTIDNDLVLIVCKIPG